MSQALRRTSHAVRFTSSSGLSLAGTIDVPDISSVQGLAVFAHHFAGSRQSPAASRICKALAEQGLMCLRFDFPGLGSSEGSFSDSSLSEYTDNVVTAAEWLRDKAAQKVGRSLPLILIGHSLGGDAAILAAHHLTEVRGVVTIGTPFTPADTIMGSARIDESACEPSPVKSYNTRDGGGDDPLVTVTLGGYELAISDSFVHDLRDTDMADALHELTCPLLILHADSDEVVPIADAERLFETAAYPKSLCDLHGCDHLLSQKGSARYVAELIAVWFSSLVSAER